jgi:hypothetical protein
LDTDDCADLDQYANRQRDRHHHANGNVYRLAHINPTEHAHADSTNTDANTARCAFAVYINLASRANTDRHGSNSIHVDSGHAGRLLRQRCSD